MVIAVSRKLPQPVTALHHETLVARLHLGQQEGRSHLPTLADAERLIVDGLQGARASLIRGCAG